MTFAGRIRLPILIAGVALCALASDVRAQWPAYPTPGVPKTADGKPDLTGPTPRTADGKPDFSGLWIRGDGQLGPAGGGTLRVPPPTFSVGPPVTTFRDVGANMKEGLPLQPWAAELVKARKAENQKDNPDALPADGLMQFHNHAPRRSSRSPGVILSWMRRTTVCGRSSWIGRKPPGRRLWWHGYSVGRWDGDTLVVETRGFRDGAGRYLGNPLTDAATEFSAGTSGRFEIDITIDDPKVHETVTVWRQ